MLSFVILVFLAIQLGDVDARPKCIKTVYIVPMLVESSVDSDFTQFRSYLANCSEAFKKGHEKTHIALLSLENQSFDSCSVWSDCGDILTGDTVNNSALTVKAHKTYDIGNFIMDNLKGDRYCLKAATLQIITNARCQRLIDYPMLNMLLHEEMPEFSNFIKVRDLETIVYWYNFDYMSSSDNASCDDLHGLKKEVGSKLKVVFSRKSNIFMNDLADQCAA